MDAAELAKLDLVLGSFHSALRLKDDQTERYLAALRNPDVHVLGHPRRRLYNYRVGLAADWPRVFAEAAKLHKAVEIDCYPDRQDLNVELLKLVAKSGACVSLGTDAHHAWQLEFIELGVAAASKAKFFPTGSSTFCRCQICKRGSQNSGQMIIRLNFDMPDEYRHFTAEVFSDARGLQYARDAPLR